MSVKTTFTAGLTAVALAASTTFVMAQATGTQNNDAATSSSSGMEMKDKGSMDKSGSMEKSGSSEPSGVMGTGDAAAVGSSQNKAKDLPGHSETPKTGQ